MKVIEIAQFGVDNLRLAEREPPQPGPGQVLVRVEAISLNYLDLMVVRGAYNPALPRPHVPGSDAAGVVEAVGPNVTAFRPGDRVTTTFIQDWLDGEVTQGHLTSRLGCDQPGVFAECIVLPEYGLVRTPDSLTSVESATLPIAGLTAWAGLFEHARLRAGQTVLVQGTGGVSLFALQLAKAARCRVIALSGSDAKLEKVRALGADDALNYRTTPDWAAAVRELTDGQGVDATLDVAGTTLDQSMRATKLNGFVGLVGWVSGMEVPFNLFPPIVGNLTLKGYTVASRSSFEAMNQTIMRDGIKPVVDSVFPAANIRQALRRLEAGQHVGKVVLTF